MTGEEADGGGKRMDGTKAKTVEEIMAQRTWSGTDAGLLFLHSTANDIANSVGGEKRRLPFTQKSFDRIVKSLVERPKEYQEFCVYMEIHNLVMDVAKEDQTFKQQFYHFYYTLLPRFQEMARSEEALGRLPKEVRADAGGMLLTPETLLSERNGRIRAEMEAAGGFMEDALTYFNVSNKVLRKLFEAFGTGAFMDGALFDTDEFKASLEELNREFEAAAGTKGRLQEKRLRKVYEPIEDADAYGASADGFEFDAGGEASDRAQRISGLRAEITRLCAEEAKERRAARRRRR